MQDVVDHRHRQVAVGGWLHRDELVGKAGGAVEDEAEVDDAGAGLACAHEVLGAAHLVLDGVAAPHVDEVRADHDARVDDRARKLAAGIVELGIERAVVQADRTERDGDAKGVREAERHQVLEAVLGGNACAKIPEDDLVRAVLVANLAELLADLVEGLIPADLLPLAFAALADALERLLQALGIIGLTACKAALLADVPIGLFRGRVNDTLHALDLAIFHDGLERTVVVIAPARAGGVDERVFRHT